MRIFKHVLVLLFFISLSGCASVGFYPSSGYNMDDVDLDTPAAKKAYKKEMAKIQKQKKWNAERLAKCVAKNKARIEEGLRPRYNCRLEILLRPKYNYNHSHHNNHSYWH